MSSDKNTVSYLAIETVNAVRRWAYSRIVLRRLMDSKRATPEQVSKAQSDYRKTSDELERYAIKFEGAIRAAGGQISAKKKAPGAPIPWVSIFGLVAEGAKALETALGGAPATSAKSGADFVRAEVIDMKEGK